MYIWKNSCPSDSISFQEIKNLGSVQQGIGKKQLEEQSSKHKRRIYLEATTVVLVRFAPYYIHKFCYLWKCHQSTSSLNGPAKAYYRAAFWIWLLITKNVKLFRLYKANIWVICFLPVSVFFGYFHSFIKLYALVTLNQVGAADRMLSKLQ
ncbi:hypothetical protein LARI1_G001641 [Lachnellula arida]|uniref:Uncharacterized protein n=1 Tax=Lachnellula arida TaxID=1316785 RepID=A0A8T9BPJ0_9HELO|nr:hypothetical protein LARI1_G001641 [Lachnellula arida]